MGESPTEAFEHAEHAEHVAHEGNAFLTTVSVTIAILAVLAATAGSLESVETAATVTEKNAAVFFQNKATDQWNFYQATVLKRYMYEIGADANPAKAEEYGKWAKLNEENAKKIQEDAKELEKQTDEKLHESDVHEGRHHVLTIGVTLLHVSIAIATISIITRGQKWPWYGSVALGLAGVVTCAAAYLH